MSDERGALVWRILFGVVMAVLLATAFFAYLSTQRAYGVGAQAQTLADDLSRTCFLALTGQGPTYDLPADVGGASYRVEIDNQNNTIMVVAEGNTYRSAVGVELELVGEVPLPGGTFYTQGRVDKIVVSSAPIGPLPENMLQEPTASPPGFYSFAKENTREAVALIAAYLHALETLSAENLDIREYERVDANNFLAQVTPGEGSPVRLRVTGHGEAQDVGHITDAWVVDSVENYSEPFSGTNCPSVENAISSGWFYTSTQITEHLRGRMWQRTADNQVVAVPEGVQARAATATTNIRTYPTYRFEFSSGGGDYVLHFRLMAWKPDEDQPGFAFESEPGLEVVT